MLHCITLTHCYSLLQCYTVLQFITVTSLQCITLLRRVMVSIVLHGHTVLCVTMLRCITLAHCFVLHCCIVTVHCTVTWCYDVTLCYLVKLCCIALLHRSIRALYWVHLHACIEFYYYSIISYGEFYLLTLNLINCEMFHQVLCSASHNFSSPQLFPSKLFSNVLRAKHSSNTLQKAVKFVIYIIWCLRSVLS